MKVRFRSEQVVVPHLLSEHFETAAGPKWNSLSKSSAGWRLGDALENLDKLHVSFVKTNRFLLVLLRSLVQRSHGSNQFVEDVLSSIDFTQYYA